jgi:type VI secretion system protein ImpF
MNRSGRKDRLSPPLMHAFRASALIHDSRRSIDHKNGDGEQIVSSRKVVISESILRHEVATDLNALMNTVALGSSIDLTSYQHVQRSILNFGLPDIVHRSIDENTIEAIPEEIRAALMHFEPRLSRDTLAVFRDQSVDPHDLRIRFLIRADLSCEPVDVPVEFTADVELDNGRIVIKRL